MTTYTKSLFTELKPVCPSMKNICVQHGLETRGRGSGSGSQPIDNDVPYSDFYKTYLNGPGSPVIEFSQEYNDSNAFYDYETTTPKVERTITKPPCEYSIPYAKPWTHKLVNHLPSDNTNSLSENKSCSKTEGACDSKTIIYDVEKQPCYYNTYPSCSTVTNECKSYEYLLQNNYRNQTLKHILEEMVPYRDDDGDGSYCLNNCNK